MIQFFSTLLHRLATRMITGASCTGVAALLFTATTYAEIFFSAQVMGPVANLYSISDDGQLTKLTDNIRWRDIDAASIANGKIAFSSNRSEDTKIDMQKTSEDFNLFTIETTGKNLRQITNDSGYDVSPKFSPNGKWLAYRRYINNQCELKLLNRSSNKSKILTIADDVFDFSWSPDSKKITFTSLTGNESALYISTVKTAETKKLIKASSIAASEKDNESKYFHAHITTSAWSPDGSKIAYILHPTNEGTRQLKVFYLDSQQDQLISLETAQVQHPITWSKDSKTLLYAAAVGYKSWYDETTYKKVYEGGIHIFVSELDGTTSQLSKGDHLFKNPVYSPDNKHIAFLYADTVDARTFSLKTMNTDGAAIKELHNAVSQRSSLFWN